MAASVSRRLRSTFGFACLAVGLCRAGDANASAPDLSVQYIGRTPRLPGPQYQYEDVENDQDGLGPIGPGKCVGPEGGGWPAPGDPVVFTAVVRNVGGSPAPAFEYAWLFDGRSVDEGVNSRPLRPGETVQFTLARSWEAGPHTVAFETDRRGLLVEASRENNIVADRTDALAMTLFVEESVDAAFGDGRVGGGWRSFADWAQSQVRRMNAHFRECRYPTCPEGVLDRLRLDAVYRIPDGWGDAAGTHAPLVLAPIDRDRPRFVKAGVGADRLPAVPFTAAAAGCDLVWGFRADLLAPDPRRGGKTYFEARPGALNGTDWALFRQVLGQLGRADHSLIAVDGADNLALPGVGYAPPPAQRDLLDLSPEEVESLSGEPPLALGQHAAASLNRDHGRRRGFFGDYLLDVPRVNRFRLQWPGGQPARGARVELFVSKGRSYSRPLIRALPSFVGLCDADGVYQLDRSPWNHVFTWATNGVLMFAVTPPTDPPSPDGEWPTSAPASPAFIGWLDIRAFNLEYWRGHVDAGEYVVRLEAAPAATTRPASAAAEPP